MITGRELSVDEVDLVWTIDRREVIENLYYHENGGLVLKAERYELSGCIFLQPHPSAGPFLPKSGVHRYQRIGCGALRIGTRRYPFRMLGIRSE